MTAQTPIITLNSDVTADGATPALTVVLMADVNWPPFRPDTWHEQGGLGISPSTGLCRTSTVASR